MFLPISFVYLLAELPSMLQTEQQRAASRWLWLGIPLSMLSLLSVRHWLWGAVVMVAVTSGCAQTARFQVWQPAEFDVAGIHRLAVLNFRGHDGTGQLARSELVARLWDSGFFTLIDPTELNATMQPQALSVEGSDDIAAAITAGRRLGVDAILVGEVIRHRADGQGRHEQMVQTGSLNPRRPSGRPGEVGGPGMHHRPLPNRETSIALSLQLVDVRTGQTRAQRQASYRANGEILNGQGYLPSQEAANLELIQKWAREMTDLLTPHRISYEVELATPRFGLATVEIRRGNSHALKGNWEKAAVCWQTALTLEPKSHVAMYNLALANAARFDYSRAVGLLEDASQLHPNITYSETLSRFQRHEQAYLMAMAQRRQGDIIASLPAPRE